MFKPHFIRRQPRTVPAPVVVVEPCPVIEPCEPAAPVVYRLPTKAQRPRIYECDGGPFARSK